MKRSTIVVWRTALLTLVLMLLFGIIAVPVGWYAGVWMGHAMTRTVFGVRP